MMNGKSVARKINLYSLFIEQCFNLLKNKGRCGIIVPTGIYSDLGTKKVREMLFSQTILESLFGLSNERFIFEGVDHRFKFSLLTFTKEGRKTLLNRQEDKGQMMDYQGYRWVHRRIVRNTDSRTLICSITPKLTFTEVNSTTLKVSDTGISIQEMLFLCGITNSFCLDWLIRKMVNSTLNMFYVYQLPVPRLTSGEPYFNEIVEHAAKLICTTPEFDDLAQEVGLGSHENGVTDETQRAKLRAELDGMIAHLYNLTEDEFKHILSTFPIVPEATKQAALAAYQTFTPLTGDPEIIDLITQGESAQLEFKSSARWDMRENKKNKEMERVILKTVAAFLNSYQGGTLLIGINDKGEVIGLNHDYQTVQKKNRDGYELFLTNDLLLKELRKDLAPYIRVTFHEVEGKDVCRIILNPSPRPVYVKLKDPKSGQTKECFFIRTGNSTSKLDSPREIHNYGKNRWS